NVANSARMRGSGQSLGVGTSSVMTDWQSPSFGRSCGAHPLSGGAELGPPPRQSFPFVNDCGTNMAMAGDGQAMKRARARAKPLDVPRLEELALTYVARFAT